MKRILMLILIVLITNRINAQIVDILTAKTIAANYLNRQNISKLKKAINYKISVVPLANVAEPAFYILIAL